MARLVYACRFRVESTLGMAPTIEAYRQWIENHYRRRRRMEDFNCCLSAGVESDALPERHTLSFRHYVTEISAAATIIWLYPTDHDTILFWQNDIRIGSFGTSCHIEHCISIHSLDFHISPARFALGSPGVIRKLCSEKAVFVGEMQVRAVPYDLDTASMSDLVTLIGSPLRKLPLIVLSPFANGDENLLDGGKMARKLAGVAIIVRISDREASWDLAEAFGRKLACFNGGVRLYWPGFQSDDDPRTHPLFLGTRIIKEGAEAVAGSIERLIFSIAAFRFVADSRISEIIRNSEQADRAIQVATNKQAGGMNWEQYALEIDGELKISKQREAELEAENANLRENQKFVFSADDDASVEGRLEETEFEPSTVLAAVTHAAETCLNIEILKSALDAADDCPFQRPKEVLDVINDLDDVAAVRKQQKQTTGSGGDIRKHLADRGWGKRCSMHISDATRSRYGNDYTFSYDGQRLLFEPHITLGSGDANQCASIHFLADQEKEKIVVAHVGRHLPNTKS